MTNIGAEAIALLRAAREHDAGNSDAANTLIAVYGIASLQGRIVSKFTFLNPPWAILLRRKLGDSFFYWYFAGTSSLIGLSALSLLTRGVELTPLTVQQGLTQIHASPRSRSVGTSEIGNTVLPISRRLLQSIVADRRQLDYQHLVPFRPRCRLTYIWEPPYNHKGRAGLKLAQKDIRRTDPTDSAQL
jgi:hypothetical protein